MSINTFRHVVSWKLNWVGNNSVNKSGAQDYILQQLTPETYPVLSLTERRGRLWAAVTKEQLCGLLRWKAGVYEILVADRKRKIYFDIDKTNIALQDIKNVILQTFPNARMQISGRDGSWRIILSNYYADSLQAMAPVVLFVQQHRELGFDTTVYTKNRNFKCINQAKPNQPVQAYIEGDQNFSKHLIMHDFDDDAVNIADMEFPLLPTPAIKQKDGTPVGKLDLLAIPQRTLSVPDNFDWLTATPLDKLAMIPCPKRGSKDTLQHDVMWRILVWCYRIGLTFEDFWAWARQREPEKYHVSPSFVDKLLIRFYPKIQESKVTQNLRQHFQLPEEVILPGINGGFYNWRDISPPKMSPSDKKDFGKQKRLDEMMPLLETRNPLPKKYTILTGPMGSGKTEALINYLKIYGKDKRVLWLTPRITLSANTQKRLEQVGIYFVNYKTIDTKQKNEGYLDTQQYVICSIQSLHYLNAPFDIVIADESERILSTFGGGATTHRSIVQQSYRYGCINNENHIEFGKRIYSKIIHGN
ncbi:hypothetical protein DFS34DRAFT_596416 [Phlyctochytrium arcticum]|nr:hypothetical protein DFS34DRAFT_596416 [Phlyctochytrium arcticum]